MLPRRSASDAGATALSLVFALLSGAAHTQAPPRPDKPWPIPDRGVERAVSESLMRAPIAPHTYDLPALIDLAERSNPDTRAAWEAARAAAAAVGLLKAAICRSSRLKPSAVFNERR